MSEASILKQLTHPNIVRYIEHFEENETAYIVMEYCQGETLDQYISYQSKQGTYSDIYSMAAILYYTLSGKTPVDAPSRVIEDKIEPLNNLNYGVSSWMEGYSQYYKNQKRE